MHMVFKVYKANKLIFTSTIKLQQGASLAQINEFTKVAHMSDQKRTRLPWEARHAATEAAAKIIIDTEVAGRREDQTPESCSRRSG